LTDQRSASSKWSLLDRVKALARALHRLVHAYGCNYLTISLWMLTGAFMWDGELTVGGIASLVVWGAVGCGTVVLAATKEVELDRKQREASSSYSKALASMCPGDPAYRGGVGNARPSWSLRFGGR
jgi:hypothetical protein